MLTKDPSKFNQMAGEARTALNMWKNTGELTKIGKFHPDERRCVLCSSKATSAEHLIDKAKGGNHTRYNVIPVCSDHKKRGRGHWRDSYTTNQQFAIYDYTGTGEDHLRLNPYIAENDAKFQELRDLINATVNKWREDNGYD